MPYSPQNRILSKLAYVNIKPKRIVDPRAKTRGEMLKQARNKAGMSQQAVADRLGLKSREAVSQWEGGKVGEIEREYRLGLCKLFGFEERELLLDPDDHPSEFDMPLSRDAIAVAQRWDYLPESLRVHIKQQMSETERVLRESPGLAKRIFPEIDNPERGPKKP
jgi:transcriptional regulator with XRE-family HTH domain